MKKSISKLLSIFVTTSLVTILAGCGSQGGEIGGSEVNGDSSKFQSNGEKLVIKFGHHLADTHSLGLEATKFAEIVAEKSKGRIEVEIYSNGVLGDQRDLLEGLKLGTVDMSLGDSGVVANYYPEMGILDLPYVFKDYEHSKRALDGELGEKLKQGVLETAGFRMLGIEPLSYRSTVLAKKEVASFDDFKGLKLRTLQAPQIVETFKSFRTQPVAMPTGEAFSAMQTGVVDGLESNPEFLTSIKIWEVGKYFVETKHNLTHETINISEQFFQSLSPEDQKLIQEAADETIEWYYNTYTLTTDEEGKKVMAENGVTLLDVDIEPFIQAAMPTVQKFVKDNGLEEFYQLIQEAEGK